MQSETTTIQMDEMGLRKHYLTLTPSQATFVRLVRAWCQHPRKLLVIVSGGPGTGKSFVVKRTLEFLKAENVKMSFTARSAQAIGGRTLHSVLHLNYKGFYQYLESQLANEWDLTASIEASRGIQNEFHFTEDPHVIVLDEVSMISGWFMHWLIHFFMTRTTQPLLLIAMGDPHQLNPVRYPHNLFSFDFSASENRSWLVRRIDLTENHRFTPTYASRIETLRQFVDDNDETGLFTYICQHFPVCDRIENTHLSQADRAMASTNDRVDTFNAYYIESKLPGKPKIDIQDKLVLKPGCLVLVTQNGYSSVSNGTELVFVRFCKYTDRLLCTHREEGMVSIRRIAETRTFPVTIGFAATIHKFQGDTIDRAKIVIDFDGNRNVNLAYTALSRVRDASQIVAIAL